MKSSNQIVYKAVKIFKLFIVQNNSKSCYCMQQRRLVYGNCSFGKYSVINVLKPGSYKCQGTSLDQWISGVVDSFRCCFTVKPTNSSHVDGFCCLSPSEGICSSGKSNTDAYIDDYHS